MENRRMCPHCRAFITTRDRVCPYCHETVGPKAATRRTDGDSVLAGFIPHARFTTTMILLLNAALYLATGLYSMSSGRGNLIDIDVDTLKQFGAKDYPLMVYRGEWWRLVTAGFLHGGLLHIAMNSWVLFDLGAQIEEVFGSTRLIVIYFCATIGGFLVSTFWNIVRGSMVPSMGASAGIMGLIGAMIALGMMHRTALGATIRGIYVRYAIYVLLFGLLPIFSVDNAAHLGGLAAGFAVAWLAGLPRQQNGWREPFWRGVSYLCLALTALSFLQMYLAFASNQH
jgi:rhomboid protease GluP